MDIGEVAGREEDGYDDLRPAIRDEVDRLPEKYRRPVQLCYWEGLSNDQAAERLECPAGTVKWRLYRARELLRDRIVRRGIALTTYVFGRRIGADGMPTSAEGPAPGLVGSLRGVEGAVLSEEFIRDTVALAVLVLDTTPLLGGGSRLEAAGHRKDKGRALRVAPLVALLATLSLSFSAFALSRRGAIAGWSARTLPGQAQTRLVEPDEAASHSCQAVVPGRIHLPTSSAEPKGLVP